MPVSRPSTWNGTLVAGANEENPHASVCSRRCKGSVLFCSFMAETRSLASPNSEHGPWPGFGGLNSSHLRWQSIHNNSLQHENDDHLLSRDGVFRAHQKGKCYRRPLTRNLGELPLAVVWETPPWLHAKMQLGTSKDRAEMFTGHAIAALLPTTSGLDCSAANASRIHNEGGNEVLLVKYLQN
jgi:hypothetical protein